MEAKIVWISPGAGRPSRYGEVAGEAFCMWYNLWLCLSPIFVRALSKTCDDCQRGFSQVLHVQLVNVPLVLSVLISDGWQVGELDESLHIPGVRFLAFLLLLSRPLCQRVLNLCSSLPSFRAVFGQNNPVTLSLHYFFGHQWSVTRLVTRFPSSNSFSYIGKETHAVSGHS